MRGGQMINVGLSIISKQYLFGPAWAVPWEEF